MTRTGHELEELRHGVDEVKDLRQEKQQQSLAEVPMDASDGECHTREVAEGVTHKDFSGEPVGLKKGKRGGNERQHCNDGKLLMAQGRAHVVQVADLVQLEEEDAASNHITLSSLESVNSGHDVDRIRAEHRQQAHEEKEQVAQLHDGPLRFCVHDGEYIDKVSQRR